MKCIKRLEIGIVYLNRETLLADTDQGYLTDQKLAG